MEHTQISNTQIAITQIHKFRRTNQRNLCICVIAICDLVHEDPSWTIFVIDTQIHKFLDRSRPYLFIMAAPRGPGFSEDETAALLDVIEDILPNCPNDWERVTEAHRISFPDLKRNIKSLKRKFEALYNHKKPTGDPTCPVIVRRAKQIWEDMRRSMDFSDAEGEISFDGDAPPPVGIPITETPTFAAAVAPAASISTVTQLVAPAVAPPVVAPAAVATETLPAPNSAAPTAAQSTAATAPILLETTLPSALGQRLRTPRRNVLTGHPSPVQPSASTTSDLIQFMIMRAELEDKRRSEREEREERRARQREEAEERRRADEAEDRRERNTMMQMFMMGIMESQRAGKRRRDDEHDNNNNN